MEKVNIGKAAVGVSPAVIAGVLVNGKPNYLALGNYGGICPRPATVYISANKAHYSNAGIREQGYYSINIPSKNLVQKTDYVGLVSGRDTDKSAVFTTFYGSVNKAPMISECPVNILCKVIQTVDLPNQEVFIAEVEETYVAAECLSDGKPDIAKISPLLMGGPFYWELGNKAGNAFSDGKVLIKK
ncbi:MAG: flavin reductase family protein [Dehalococcoidales bacterium]|nr:flavin reductase family protein [Dehalococcoidales bacterium]